MTKTPEIVVRLVLCLFAIWLAYDAQGFEAAAVVTAFFVILEAAVWLSVGIRRDLNRAEKSPKINEKEATD